MANIANPLPYITQREYGVLPDLKAKLFDNRLSAAKNLYRKDLTCHYGCVNAIEFSNDSEVLISGGDDKRVMLWQLGKLIVDRGKPEAMKFCHSSNIFCLGINHDQKKIFSGGNDDIVMVHDVESKLPVEVLRHQRAVCSLSIDPFNDRMVTTAGNDGRLLLFDTRQSVHESLVIARSRRAFQGVMFNPRQQGLLVSANARDGVSLWDLKSPKHPVISYSGNHGTLQNSMSACFNSSGTHVLALRRRLAPVLYQLHSAEPAAEFYHQDYYNSCTMKSCCFAGQNDEYVLSGSDDFNLYMWKVPEVGSDSVVVESPHVVLNGHRSIVNQVRFNPRYSIVASSGVEKIIKLWSTMEYPGMRGALLGETTGSENPREIYSHEDYMSLVHRGGRPFMYNSQNQTTSEDPCMMAFFDSLVQRELECLAEESDSSATLQQSSSEEEERPLGDPMPFVLPPKRAHSGNRSQRCPNRMARSVSSATATRYPKNSRCQKRSSLGRPKNMDRRMLLSKFKMLPSGRGRGARSRSASRGRRRPTTASGSSQASSTVSSGGIPSGAFGSALQSDALSRTLELSNSLSGIPMPQEPLPPNSFIINGFVIGPGVCRPLNRYTVQQTLRDEPSSDRSDSDEPRPPYRPEGRTRAMRRRMAQSRATNRKSKTPDTEGILDLRCSARIQDCDNDTTFSNIDQNVEANMSLPSTSTGYRGHSAPPLFRMAEADSDDDQPVASRPVPPPIPPPVPPPAPPPVSPPDNGGWDMTYHIESRLMMPLKPGEHKAIPRIEYLQYLDELELHKIREKLKKKHPETDNSNLPPGNRHRSDSRRGRRTSRPNFSESVLKFMEFAGLTYKSEVETSSSESSEEESDTHDSM